MILFDGCSWTYGSELENREKERWSTLVANGEEHVNLSSPGKSNDGILRTTLEFCESNHVDTAVIQFTKHSRTEFRQEGAEKYITVMNGHINPHRRHNSVYKEISEIYFKYFHNKELHLENYSKNKFLLENYFKQKNIKYFFCTIGGYTNWTRKDISKNPSSWYRMMDKESITYIPELIGLSKIATVKGRHPTAEEHRIIADHISLNIRNL